MRLLSWLESALSSVSRTASKTPYHARRPRCRTLRSPASIAEALDARVVLSAVSVTQQFADVTVEEGRTATNFGYAMSDSATISSVSASVGALAYDAQWGLWQWSLNSTNGPLQSQDIVITATDSEGVSNFVSFRLDVTNVAPSISLHTADEAVYQGVSLPLGALSFADQVTALNLGTNTAFVDATQTLGVPTGGDNSRGLTLGNGGSVTLQFTDLPLVDQNSVAGGADLFVFDLGLDAEEATIEISADGTNWVALAHPVAMRAGEPTGIDITSIATAGTEYHFVRITDVYFEGEYDPFYVGTDIDAVGVVGQVAPIEVNVGQTATYSGAFRDAGLDVVTLSASMGTVTQSGSNSGEWNWSYSTSNADAGTQTVSITATDADGGVSIVKFDLVCRSTSLLIDIDVLPNRINLNRVSGFRDFTSNRFVPVVIFTTEAFNARNIDPGTIVFAGAQAVKTGLCDVDGDGDKDLVAFFKLRDTNLFDAYRDSLRGHSNKPVRRDIQVGLTAKTRDGVALHGEDVVQLVMRGKALRELLDSL